jgi:diguanylate cyclase (GGDEF)-like protein/PAS domain S-box-containing protein
MLRHLFPGATSKLLPVAFSVLLALIVVVALLGYLHSEPLLVAGVGALVVLGGVGIAVTATRQVMRTENELAREKELAQVTLHSIGDGVITTDIAGRVEYMNPVAEQYTGWGVAEARGRTLVEVCHVVDEQTGQRVDMVLQAEGGAPEPQSEGAAVRLIGVGGRDCSIRYSRTPIQDRDGGVVGSIVVFHDVSQIRSMAQQLLWQASHDALTGLVNRLEFERRLEALIETARRQDREHALMFMDLDNFKAVNDSCGHRAGDELLRQLTTVMMTCMRGSDTLARLGGDEFGALLESCPGDQALRIANATRETVREFRFVWEDKTFSVGVSIGLVPINADSGDINQVLGLADACCYEAKSRGRDRVQAYRPHEAEPSARPSELQVVSEISRAFETGGFQLYRQLIAPLNAASGAQGHYEVLVRMLDTSGELVPPSVFMHAAERYNRLRRWNG